MVGFVLDEVKQFNSEVQRTSPPAEDEARAGLARNGGRAGEIQVILNKQEVYYEVRTT
jgi:hypothetical protein